MTTDPATGEGLIVEEEIPERVLYRFLAEYIRIGKDSGRVIKRDEFDDLNLRQRVIVALLTQIAKDKLSVLDEEESRKLTPKDIARFLNTESTDVYPMIRKLERNEIIEREDRQYYIPPDKFEDAKSMFP